MSAQRARDAIIHLSTLGATKVGTNSWNITVGEQAYHGRNIAQFYPIYAIVPNVFPNVRAPNNTIRISQDGGGTFLTLTIAEGFYTGPELATAINAQWLAAAGNTDVAFSFVALTAAQGEFRVTVNSANVVIIEALTLDNLGINLGVDLILPLTIPAATPSTVSLGEPNLAGERVVHITSEKLGHTMGGHSSAPSAVDLCLSVPMTGATAVYGGTGVWQPSDSETSKLDMAFDINLANGVEISLWDSRFRPLTLPDNLAIELQLKIVHAFPPA